MKISVDQKKAKQIARRLFLALSAVNDVEDDIAEEALSLAERKCRNAGYEISAQALSNVRVFRIGGGR